MTLAKRTDATCNIAPRSCGSENHPSYRDVQVDGSAAETMGGKLALHWSNIVFIDVNHNGLPNRSLSFLADAVVAKRDSATIRRG